MMEQSKRSSLSVARSILNHKVIGKKLESFLKGENPFTDNQDDHDPEDSMIDVSEGDAELKQEEAALEDAAVEPEVGENGEEHEEEIKMEESEQGVESEEEREVKDKETNQGAGEEVVEVREVKDKETNEVVEEEEEEVGVEAKEEEVGEKHEGEEEKLVDNILPEEDDDCGIPVIDD